MKSRNEISSLASAPFTNLATSAPLTQVLTLEKVCAITAINNCASVVWKWFPRERERKRRRG